MVRSHHQGYQWRLGSHWAAGVLTLVGAILAFASGRPVVRADEQQPMVATAVLSTSAGDVVGAATFTQQADRVLVEVTVNGPPSP